MSHCAVAQQRPGSTLSPPVENIVPVPFNSRFNPITFSTPRFKRKVRKSRPSASKAQAIEFIRARCWRFGSRALHWDTPTRLNRLTSCARKSLDFALAASTGLVVRWLESLTPHSEITKTVRAKLELIAALWLGSDRLMAGRFGEPTTQEAPRVMHVAHGRSFRNLQQSGDLRVRHICNRS